ncbi:hypothetical protein MKD33_19640, partial [Chromobacterium piscinae]
EKALDAGHAVL